MTRIGIALAGLAVMASSAAQAVEPLSCPMQATLSKYVAWHRDQGASKAEVTTTIKSGAELTPQEIREILDRVYVKMRKRAPDQIAEAVMQSCGG